MTQTTLPLGTKVCVPAFPPSFIRRARLEEMLADGSRRSFTLVSAAPGSGKTTLLAGWFRARDEGAGAWLSLDSRDNDPERLTGAILGALSRAGIAAAPDRRTQLDVTALDAAFEGIASDARRVLVLDDAQELTSPEALAILSHLAERAPATLDVVVATRADPPLGLGRLRLAGRLGDVRGADLAFTLSEARSLLDAQGLVVTEDDARNLWERTEGWAAGLRLVVSSLERGADPTRLLAGVGAEGTEITEYLVHEVLLRQEQGVQDFLLRTSIADRITPGLATVLSEDPDAGHRLSELENRGVFLVRLEGADWFRYHPLLAMLLRGRLRQQDPALAAALQRRAAEWFARHGMAFEAEELARTSGDWDLLGDLLARRWLDTVLDGEDVQAHMVRDIPPDAISATPMLSLLAAAEAGAAHDAIAAEHHRRTVGSGSAADLVGRSALAPVEVVTALVDVLHGCAFGGGEREEAGGRYLSRSTGVDARTDYYMALRRADRLLDVDDVRGAQRELGPLVDASEPRGLVLEGMAMRSLLHAVTGQLSSAEGLAADVLAPAIAPTRARTIASLASLLVESQRGEGHGVGRRRSADGPRLDSRPLRAVERAVRSWLANGAAIVGLDGAAARHPFAQRALVALGVMEVVDSEHRIVTLGGPAEAAVGRARAALANGAHPTVLADLEPWVGPGADDVLPRTSIEAQVLAAISWQAQGHHGEANDLVRMALIAASSEGALAPLVCHGASLVSSLEHLSNEVAPYQGLAIRLIDAVRRMRPMSFVDPLTDRERVVLCFLPTMMTNAEIAASMHVSVNTIKTHLKALYRKLDVERRRDAVLRARQLELL